MSSELTIYDIRPKQKFSFEVYPTAILGNNFQNVQLLAINDAETARRLGWDVDSLHATIYPTLPSGVVEDDPDSYPYVEIKTISGQRHIVGVEWIKPGTIETIVSGRVTMIFENRNPADIDRILESLSAIGQSPSSIRRES